MENGKFIVKGTHEKVEDISESLQRRLLENGMPQGELDALMKGGKSA